MTEHDPRSSSPVSSRASTASPNEREQGGSGSPHRGTNPGSFANPPDIGGALSFSSPDTPGMPPPSDKTAWDFMPPDWTQKDGR